MNCSATLLALYSPKIEPLPRKLITKRKWKSISSNVIYLRTRESRCTRRTNRPGRSRCSLFTRRPNVTRSSLPSLVAGKTLGTRRTGWPRWSRLAWLSLLRFQQCYVVTAFFRESPRQGVSLGTRRFVPQAEKERQRGGGCKERGAAEKNRGWWILLQRGRRWRRERERERRIGGRGLRTEIERERKRVEKTVRVFVFMLFSCSIVGLIGVWWLDFVIFVSGDFWYWKIFD